MEHELLKPVQENQTEAERAIHMDSLRKMEEHR